MTTTEPNGAGDDLRSAIEAAYDTPADNAAPAVAANDPLPEGEDEYAVPAAKKADATDKGARDDKGRFAKTEAGTEAKTATTAAEKPAAQDAGKQDLTDITAEKPPTEQNALPAPAHWGGSAKVRWDKLPTRVQEAISKDYADLATERQKYGALEQVLTPSKPLLSMRYGDEVTGIKTLLAYAEHMEKDPLATIQHIARERGIDLGRLAPQQGQGTIDPNHAATAQPHIVQQLQQELQQLKSHLQQGNTQTLQSQIDAFASNPKHPYFNDVRVHMGALMSAGAAKTLEEAYEQAIYANPAIRAELQAQQREAEEAARAKKLQEARAAQTIKGSPGTGGSVSTPPPATLRGSIEDAWDALS
jgi:hypothetical protein